jgi:hypothetical protein
VGGREGGREKDLDSSGVASMLYRRFKGRVRWDGDAPSYEHAVSCADFGIVARG